LDSRDRCRRRESTRAATTAVGASGKRQRNRQPQAPSFGKRMHTATVATPRPKIVPKVPDGRRPSEIRPGNRRRAALRYRQM